MDDSQLLARLGSIDERLGDVDKSIRFINHELGELSGKVEAKNASNNNTKISPITILIIKYVVLPLIIIIGGIVGVKEVFPL